MEAFLKPASSTFSLGNYSCEKGYFTRDSLCFTTRRIMPTSHLRDIQRKWNVKDKFGLSALAINVGGQADKLPNKKYSFGLSAMNNEQVNILPNPNDKHGQGENYVLHNELSVAQPDQTGYGAILKKLQAFVEFCRPYAMIGMLMGILSLSLLPVQSVADFSPKFFMGLMQSMTLGVLVHIYNVAVNQLYDIEIDKINKQHLPFASGEFSQRDVVGICVITSMLGLGVSFLSKSPALIFGLVANFLLGTAYSADLPYLRWKRNPLLATPCMLLWYALGIQIPYYIHIQRYVLGRPVLLTKSLVFQTAMLCTFCIVAMILKDVPDADGDGQNGIQTTSTLFGQERAFSIGVNLLLAQFVLGTVVGATSSLWFCKIVAVLGHLALALVVLYRSRQTDPKNIASSQAFYMLFWKVVPVQYLLIHFIR